MTLYKLTGYDPPTDVYINPISGQIENLPNTPFVISDIIPDGYDNFDAPENWAKYAIAMIGTVFGLREYRSLRWEIYTRLEIIAGADYANWDILTEQQKSVAVEWSNIRIVNTKGIEFYVTQCGGQNEANIFIDTYLKRAQKASELRYYMAFTKFGFIYLGKLQGLKAESYARADFLDTTYIVRGVAFKSEDGIDGIGDWILGTNGYSITGLKPRIVSGEFVLGGGMDVDTFCNSLIAIIDDGSF